MLRVLLAVSAVLLVLLTPTIGLAEDGPTGPPYTDGPSVKTGGGTLIDAAGQPIGYVQLNQDANGVVKILLDASKLPPGPHGIHFHAVGRCEGPGFTTAGGHFNPAGNQHGLHNPAGAHNGDLPQIDEVTVENGLYRATTDRLLLVGGGPANIYDADGTALVIHAVADDQVTDPTGNSGARIACAILAAPQDTTTATPPVAPGPPSTGTTSGAGESGGAPWVPLAIGLEVLAAAVLLGRFVMRRRA